MKNLNFSEDLACVTTDTYIESPESLHILLSHTFVYLYMQ